MIDVVNLFSEVKNRIAYSLFLLAIRKVQLDINQTNEKKAEIIADKMRELNSAIVFENSIVLKFLTMGLEFGSEAAYLIADIINDALADNLFNPKDAVLGDLKSVWGAIF